jgi:AP-1-like factor
MILTYNRAAIQQHPDYQDGSIDIDSLCTELRQKAKCSETGVVIDQKDVDAAFQRLPALGNSPNSLS